MFGKKCDDFKWECVQCEVMGKSLQWGNHGSSWDEIEMTEARSGLAGTQERCTGVTGNKPQEGQR